MLRPIGTLALLVGLFGAAPAQGAEWSSFESMFAAFPCSDGWTACIVGGRAVTPEPAPGGGAFLVAAHHRLDWGTLEAAPGLSPFAGLSAYTGKAPSAPEPEAEPEADPEPAVVDAEPSAPPPARQPEPDYSGGGDPTPPPRASNGGSTGSSSPSTPSAVVKQPSDPTPVAPAAATGGDPMVKPRTIVAGNASDPAPAPSTPPSGPAAPATPVGPGKGAPEPAVAAVEVRPPPVAATPDTCDNLTLIEPAAMMGKLSDGQHACLEASLGATAVQTDKDKISRVLMANAWAKGDKKTWEQLVKRHLDEIDQSDPDICYKYALYLSQKGVGRANGVIQWADAALENKTRWSGENYKSRVYSLYKLRAAAAQDLWKAAEEKNASSPTDTSKAAVEKARNQTKTYSREWYEYAKEAGKDTTVALQLCISAAGTKEFCEGI